MDAVHVSVKGGLASLKLVSDTAGRLGPELSRNARSSTRRNCDTSNGNASGLTSRLVGSSLSSCSTAKSRRRAVAFRRIALVLWERRRKS